MGLGSCKHLVTILSSIKQYLTCFYAFLLKDTLFNACWWFIDWVYCQQHYDSRLSEGYATHVFLHKLHHSFCALRNPNQHFRTVHGGHFIVSHRKVRDMTLQRMTKGSLFLMWEPIKDSKLWICLSSVGACISGNSKFLSAFSHPGMTIILPQGLIRGLQINFGD